jgi:hypothetical protein
MTSKKLKRALKSCHSNNNNNNKNHSTVLLLKGSGREKQIKRLNKHIGENK